MFCYDCGKPSPDGSFDCKGPDCFDGLPIEDRCPTCGIDRNATPIDQSDVCYCPKGVGRPVTPPVTIEEHTWLESMVDLRPAKDMTGWIIA